jgi:hypothetical protein
MKINFVYPKNKLVKETWSRETESIERTVKKEKMESSQIVRNAGYVD